MSDDRPTEHDRAEAALRGLAAEVRGMRHEAEWLARKTRQLRNVMLAAEITIGADKLRAILASATSET